MRKKTSGIGVFLLVVATALIAYSLFVILSEPRLLQYIVPADNLRMDTTDPDGNVQSMLKERRMTYEESDLQSSLDNVMQAHTLSGYAPKVAVGTHEDTLTGSAITGLIAAGEDYFTVYEPLPLLGRLINSEELEIGSNVALLDEQLALALFQMSEAVDREITLGGEVYRVVGVLRHNKQVGDDADHSIYVPYHSLERSGGVQLQTLMVTGVPLPKGGAMITFSELMEGWMSGGSAYDLNKEKIGAWIWARYLLCGLGYAVWGLLVGAYVRSVTGLFARLRQRLTESYMIRLLPWFLFQLLLRLIGLALLAGAVGGLTIVLLDPINAYPEYVPQVLVEPKEIANSFWFLRAADAIRVVCSSPEVVRLTYFASVVKSAVVVFLAGLSVLFFRRQRG